jgi:multidrug efflux pump subunit AcrA (membrane-fusion protein)
MFARINLRNLFLLALVVAAAGGGYYYWQQREAARRAAAINIRQEVVQRGTIVSTVNATGHLAAQEQANLYFTAAAGALPVVEVAAALGDQVRGWMTPSFGWRSPRPSRHWQPPGCGLTFCGHRPGPRIWR